MIYYRRNKKILEEFQNKEDRGLLRYPTIDDIRNMAFSIFYKDGVVEQVLRTIDLKNHYLALQLLYKKSLYLKKYVSYQDVSVLNVNFEKIPSGGNMFLSNMTADFREELGGLLYLPKNFTYEMKDFLRTYEESLYLFPDMGIYQDEQDDVNVLCEFGRHEHKEILKNILK